MAPGFARESFCYRRENLVNTTGLPEKRVFWTASEVGLGGEQWPAWGDKRLGKPRRTLPNALTRWHSGVLVGREFDPNQLHQPERVARRRQAGEQTVVE